MFKNKTQQPKIFNNNLPLFNLLCLFTTIYLGVYVNLWYLLFLILIVIISLQIRINIWQGIICLGIGIIYAVLILVVPKFSLFYELSKALGSNIVRDKIFNFLNKTYSPETSNFIKLILFNVKSKDTYIFYKQTVDLGIVWLVCVGGFHVSFLSRILKKIFKNIWDVGKWIAVFIILVYSYLLKFSYSSMRVLFMLLLCPLFNKFEIKSYNMIGLIGLIFCLLNPKCFTSYSFLLSFAGVTSAYYVLSLGISNKILNSLLMSVLGFTTTIPFVINMNHKISLLTFLNSFIFSYLFAIVFLYFLIFSWMPFMALIHHYVILIIYAVVGNISYLNIFIYCKSWEPYITFAFYSGYYAITKLVYLIVLNNKI